MSLCSSYVFHLSCHLCITYAFFIGEGDTLLTSREIDVTYLDSNEEEIKIHFQKFKDDWLTHGITLMCDSWTGPMGMGIINFMVYCNCVMFFHKSVDSTSHNQGVQYILWVTINLHVLCCYLRGLCLCLCVCICFFFV
jgi:hypothetical protein